METKPVLDFFYQPGEEQSMFFSSSERKDKWYEFLKYMFFLKGKDKLFPDDCGRQDDGKGKLCFGDPELCRQSKFYFNLSIFLYIYLYIKLSLKLCFGDLELCRQRDSSVRLSS